MSQQQRLPVFLSFRATLSEMRQGKVTAKDLETGVFYFGCTRVHVMNPGSQGEVVESEVRLNPVQLQELVAALTVAEAEGRVDWRQAEQPSSYKQLQGLLVARGLRGFKSEYLVRSYSRADRYQEIVDPCIDSKLLPRKIRLIR